MPLFQVGAKLLSVFRDKRIVVLMGLATLIILVGAALPRPGGGAWMRRAAMP